MHTKNTPTVVTPCIKIDGIWYGERGALMRLQKGFGGLVADVGIFAVGKLAPLLIFTFALLYAVSVVSAGLNIDMFAGTEGGMDAETAFEVFFVLAICHTRVVLRHPVVSGIAAFG